MAWRSGIRGRSRGRTGGGSHHLVHRSVLARSRGRCPVAALTEDLRLSRALISADGGALAILSRSGLPIVTVAAVAGGSWLAWRARTAGDG